MFCIYTIERFWKLTSVTSQASDPDTHCWGPQGKHGPLLELIWGLFWFLTISTPRSSKSINSLLKACQKVREYLTIGRQWYRFHARPSRITKSDNRGRKLTRGNDCKSKEISKIKEQNGWSGTGCLTVSFKKWSHPRYRTWISSRPWITKFWFTGNTGGTGPN